MNIASLEDDADQAELIRHTLTGAGYKCTAFANAKALLDVLRKQQPFDLILVDWELPDITGIEVVRWVRTHVGYELPLMFVTGRTQESDLVAGLQAGADDYVTKPIRARELTARIEALLRRRAVETIQEPSVLQVGRHRFDTSNDTAWVNEEPVVLAPKEFELAVLFFRNPGRLFSRDVLSATVWNRDIPATSRTLDTHLSNMRRKLKLHPENGVRLSSSYALGYRLELLADEVDTPPDR